MKARLIWCCFSVGRWQSWNEGMPPRLTCPLSYHPRGRPERRAVLRAPLTGHRVAPASLTSADEPSQPGEGPGQRGPEDGQGHGSAGVRGTGQTGM